MSAEDKLKAAGIAVGSALATAAAFLGFKSHEDRVQQEQEQLQVEYLASQVKNRQHITENHDKIREVCQDLGRFNPEGKFAHRFSKAGAGKQTEPSDPAKQPEIDFFNG